MKNLVKALNITRVAFVTARSLIRRLYTLFHYQQVTRDLDWRNPNATKAASAEVSGSCAATKCNRGSRPSRFQAPRLRQRAKCNNFHLRRQPTVLR